MNPGPSTDALVLPRGVEAESRADVAGGKRFRKRTRNALHRWPARAVARHDDVGPYVTSSSTVWGMIGSNSPPVRCKPPMKP